MDVNKRVLLAAAITAVGNAWAGATVNFGDDKSLSVGFGMRESYTNADSGTPDGSRSSDFNLDSARIFLGASLNKNIKGMLNTEWDGDKMRILDAAGEFAISPELNIWAGRLLSPSDRANMAGPYYSMGGGYWAGVASRYGYNGGIFRGRDDGVVLWGNAGDGGRLGYSFGAFEGHTFGIGSMTQAQAKSAGIKSDDALMYSGRVQYDFWDPEPGYYGTGNYLGGADILAIGVAGRYQKDGILTVGAVGKYSSYNVDFLLEKRIKGAGAFALEAAWYQYNTDDIIKAEQGKAYSAGVSYIFEDKAGWGKFQPFVRGQKFAADTGIDTRQYDVGTNYIIDGYKAQISAVYSKTKMTSSADADKLSVALQLQF